MLTSHYKRTMQLIHEHMEAERLRKETENAARIAESAKFYRSPGMDSVE